MIVTLGIDRIAERLRAGRLSIESAVIEAAQGKRLRVDGIPIFDTGFGEWHDVHSADLRPGIGLGDAVAALARLFTHASNCGGCLTRRTALNRLGKVKTKRS